MVQYVRPMLDSLIDQILDCQEDFVMGKIHSVTEINSRLAKILKILDFKGSPQQVHKQVCSSVVEYLSLGFIGQYESQTTYFKQLVSRQNSLMPFYIAVLNMDLSQQTPRKLSLLQLKSVLQGQKKLLCEKCGHYGSKLNNHQAHQKSCDGIPMPGKLLLTLKKDSYLCQLGCPGELSEKEIITHMINQHDDQELEGWGISKVNLSKMLKFTVQGDRIQSLKNFKNQNGVATTGRRRQHDRGKAGLRRWRCRLELLVLQGVLQDLLFQHHTYQQVAAATQREERPPIQTESS